MPLWRPILLLASALLFGLLACGSDAAGTGRRVEVPISERRLSDGNIRYSVPVRIGNGAPIEAMLDTGSFGLRVMADAVSPSQYKPTEYFRRYRFGSGVVLEGILARAVVQVGEAKTPDPVVIQVVQSVSCAAMRPDCPAARLSPADYRIGGDGLPREGFQAILGLSMRVPDVPSPALNPLDFVGERKWIVELPLPGSGIPGKLIVNPNTKEVAGYRLYPVALTPPWEGSEGGETDGRMRETVISGCIGAPSAATARDCAPMKMDTGARDGLEPFYVYKVLYDQKNGTIGFKER